VSISVFTILGRVAYSVSGERRADWPPKLQAVVGALLIQAGRPISRTQLARWVWPEEEIPASLSGTLHTYSGRIRRILEHADGGAKLVGDAGMLRIDVDPNLVDYHVFRVTADEARAALRRGDPRRALARASAAIGLWQREGPLAGLSSAKVDNWRRGVIDDEWLPAQDTLLSALLRLGEFQQAQVRLNELQRDHPDSHLLIARRLETLHGLGNLDEATRYFSVKRKMLLEQGEDVAAVELTRLHERSLNRPATAAVVIEQPPPAPRPLRHHLPPDVRTFVGREAYLAKLDAVAVSATGRRRPSLVVLDGQAGVGKTALALRWAHRLGPGEAVFYYDLQGFSAGPPHEADEVIDELLAALDYPVERLATPTQRRRKLRDLLAERPLTVVLDNVAKSEHVRDLLPLLADCTVLLTSRRRLTGLQTLLHANSLPITPLATHEGAALLTELMGRRAERAPQTVTTLAQLSGGLPMALQVIAHHAEQHPDVPLTAIIDDLRDVTTLLSIGEDGDLPAVSLRASFEMSYNKLSPVEQDLFATIALHPGHEISLHAAAALAGRAPGTVRKGLDALSGAHMLEPASNSIRRYRMHDLLRSFGQERAMGRDAMINDNAQLRLLSWYLHSTSRACRTMFPHQLRPSLLPVESDVVPMDFATSRQANSWLLDEQDNLLDVIAWARRRYPSYAARLPFNLYRTLRQYGHYAEAREALNVAIDAAQIVGDVELEAASRHDLGQILLAVREPDAASREFLRASALAQRARSDAGITMCAYSLAGIAVREANFDEGIALYRAALDRAESANLVESQSAILLMLGQTYRGRSERIKAFPYLKQALWLAGTLHHSHLLIKTLVPLAEVSAELGDHRGAQVHAARALRLLIDSEDLEEAPAVFLALARVGVALGRHQDAKRYARQALRFARERKNVPVEAESLEVLADILLALKCVDGAGEGWALAREILLDLGDRKGIARLESKIAKLGTSAA
jgi:tetratricopeptide (TPR) repeat protein/DNA-binding SARP family transcriptional activator